MGNMSCSITLGVEWSILLHNHLYIDMIESSGTHTTSTSLYNAYIYWEHELSCSITLGVEWSILFQNQLYIDIIESSWTHTTSTSPYNMYIYGKHELLYHIACVWSGVSCSRINTTLILWKSVGHTQPVHLYTMCTYICLEHVLLYHIAWV